MNPLNLELDLGSAVQLHLALGEEDGRLVALRRRILDYLYENLSIGELEELERIKHEGGASDTASWFRDKKGK